jgi:hypothetical protein
MGDLVTRLEWSQHPGPYPWKTRHFAVADYGDDRIVAWWIPTLNQPHKLGEFKTHDEAKAACQAHQDECEAQPPRAA